MPLVRCISNMNGHEIFWLSHTQQSVRFSKRRTQPACFEYIDTIAGMWLGQPLYWDSWKLFGRLWSYHRESWTKLNFVHNNWNQGCEAGVVRIWSFFGWSRIPNNTGSRSRIFCPISTLEVQLVHFLHHTLKLGIPVELVQFILKLLLKLISYCAPQFPLILTTANFVPFMLRVGVGSRKFWKGRSRIFYLWLRNLRSLI